jgi:opacity protein-like surface antigen
VKVSDNIALRLEYRYADYQSEGSSAATNFNDSIPGIIAFSQSASVQADLDAQIHTVRGAVVLQLGNP